MANETDSFIDEVTEEVRRDRLFALMRKYGWIAIAAMLAIVGGTAWQSWQGERATRAAQEFGDAVLAAMQAPDPAAALEGVQAEGAARQALVTMLSADERITAGETEAAVAALSALGADAAVPASLRDLARLKAVLAAGDTMEPAARDAVLAELAQPGAPYRLLAMEQQAVTLLAAGDREGAIARARDILSEAGGSSGLQQRVKDLIVALDGDLPG